MGDRRTALPPADADRLMDAVHVRTKAAWHVVPPLWTKEEGRSDISATLTVVSDGDGTHVELDDVLVPWRERLHVHRIARPRWNGGRDRHRTENKEMHMRLVEEAGPGGTTATERPSYDMSRTMRLDGLGVTEFARTMGSMDQARIEARSTAISDARRFVRRLSARMPTAEVGGRCTWALAGDVLGHILPIFSSMDDVETATRALRLTIGLVMVGEHLGAGMQVRDAMLSMHGDGRQGMLTVTYATTEAAVETIFGIGPAGMERTC